MEMNMEKEKIANRLKQIRKIKQRSLHDCANLLGISKEEYLGVEEGQHSLSLPELELLALFFEIPPESLLEDSSFSLDHYSILQDDKKPIFTNLRSKMIAAQLASERQNLGISLEEMNERTGISMEILEIYENGHSSIPLDHLALMCDQLDLSIQSLLFQLKPKDENIDETPEQTEWRPELSEHDPEVEEQGDDLYHQIIQGMKTIPEKDQAEIAKMILQRMRN
jgi:transcriptional regulator with XRE-family HTH domain